MSAADLTEIIDGIGKGNSVFGLITPHKERHPLMPVQIVECCRMRQAMRLGEFPHTGHKILHPIPKFLVTHTNKRFRVVTRSLPRLEAVRADFGSPRLSQDTGYYSKKLAQSVPTPVPTHFSFLKSGNRPSLKFGFNVFESAAETRSEARSSNVLPMTCTPIGTLRLEKPAGTVTIG